MKKKWEVRYLVTAVASIPVYKAYGKTETYRQAAKDGWGTVYRDENNALVCDEDCSASLYTKNGDFSYMHWSSLFCGYLWRFFLGGLHKYNFFVPPAEPVVLLEPKRKKPPVPAYRSERLLSYVLWRRRYPDRPSPHFALPVLEIGPEAGGEILLPSPSLWRQKTRRAVKPWMSRAHGPPAPSFFPQSFPRPPSSSGSLPSSSQAASRLRFWSGVRSS